MIGDQDSDHSNPWVQSLSAYLVQAGGTLINNSTNDTSSTYWATIDFPTDVDYFIIALGYTDVKVQTPILTFIQNLSSIRQKIISLKKPCVCVLRLKDDYAFLNGVPFYVYYQLQYIKFVNMFAIYNGTNMMQNVPNHVLARNVLNHLMYGIKDSNIEYSYILANVDGSYNIKIRPDLSLLAWYQGTNLPEGLSQGDVYQLGDLGNLYRGNAYQANRGFGIPDNIVNTSSEAASISSMSLYIDSGNALHYESKMATGGNSVSGLVLFPPKI